MTAFLLILFTFPLLQEDHRDRLVLADRTILEGQFLGSTEDGSLRWGAGKATRFIDCERVRRLDLQGRKKSVPDPGPSRVFLLHGSLLTGNVVGFESGRLTVQTVFGNVTIDRKHLESILFTSDLQLVSEKQKEGEGKDLLFYTDPKSGLSAFRRGKLERIGKDRVVVEVKGKQEEIGRKEVKEIRFFPRPELFSAPSGWFAKIRFQNGDRVVGMLFESGKDRLRLFSHILGNLSIPMETVKSIHFSPEARTTWGRILVCDRTGVQAVDRTGKVHWSYTKRVNFSGAAILLETGNVLIAATSFNKVLEISPKGEIVWTLSGVSYPYDVERLPNGNTLVAEQIGNKVSEFDPQGVRVWTYSNVTRPTSVQRLDNGHTLIGSDSGVFEVDQKGNRVWKARLNRVRPWRARLLENGNILICDQVRGQVIEITRAGNEIWKMTGLARPMTALRMENGRTLILEQSSNRIIEVDASRRIVHQIDGFNYPQAISIY